jgi:hypothetical protein
MLFGLGPLEIIAILLFILLIFLLPYIIRRKMISSVTRVSMELEEMVEKCKKILVKLCQEEGKSKTDPSKLLDNFMEFFVIPPVALDPQGIVEKYRKILDMGEDQFQRMATQMAPEADEETQANIIMTLKSTLGLNGVFKMVRHNLLLAKKTGNLQILLMLQMGLPLIMRLVKAQFEGTKAFAEAKPIGDGLGPLIAGMLLKGSGELKEDKGMVIGRREMDGRHVIIARAQGPGARVGKIGKVITSLIEEEDLKRIITVDAAVKMEGEKTGAVAEGIGVVIGGPGVDKWMIEQEMVKKDVETDAIIVKMSPEEAIGQMNEDIMTASKKALCVVRDSLYRSDIGSKVLVVGVGNSSGLPNVIIDPKKLDIKKEKHVDDKEGRKWRF